MTIIDYAVVKAADLEKLRELVKEGFGEGWVPQGGIEAVFAYRNSSSNEPGMIYLQAMVKVQQ